MVSVGAFPSADMTSLPLASNHMSGTFWASWPLGHDVLSLAGVIHWCGVPSEIHGVRPPWRCSTARFCWKQDGSCGVSVHTGLRTSSSTVPWSTGSIMPAIGPMPEPIIVVSVGRKRLPAPPVGSRLWRATRTGTFFCATMNGPSHCGGVTA